MKRKLLLFAGVLFLMLALKYVFGQEPAAENTGWYPAAEDDPAKYVIGVLIAAALLGSVFAVIRVLAQRFQRPVLEPMNLK